jgi:hypothetical protein
MTRSKLGSSRNLRLRALNTYTVETTREKPESISGGGKQAVDAWVRVLRAMLPIVVQSLPAEEYQVGRSTEHTDAVARTTKGIIAGFQELQSSFADLRALLTPVPHLQEKAARVA